MRRPLLLATAALATLTALALLGGAVAVRPPALPAEADGPREAANRALAHAFYDAANAVIAAGDPAPLAALVAPGFVERGAAPDAEPDRDGLVRRLLAIHAAASGLRLAVEAVAADGDLVIAHVRVSGGASPAFLGLRLDDAWTAWGPVDVFRVERGRIVERWGPAADPAPPAPALQVALEVPPPEDRPLAVARVTLAPGARHVAPASGGPRLVIAETGSIRVEPVGAPGPGAAPPTTLTAGEHLVAPPSAAFAARNTGRTPAALLEVALAARPWVASPTMPAAPPPAEGVAVQIIAGDLLIAVPARPAILAIGRATLEPGERLAWAAAPGPVLLHVEAGTLDLAATGEVPWVRAVASERSPIGIEATLAAGGGALLEAGAAAEVRASPANPATVLILTLLPADGSLPAGAEHDEASPGPSTTGARERDNL